MNRIINIGRGVINNKIFLYLTARYASYIVQFCFSIMIAVKLGPQHMGSWGVILLLLNYFLLTNFGVSNAVNILLVREKSNLSDTNSIIKTSLVLTFGLFVILTIIGAYVFLNKVPYLEKYELKNGFFLILLIAALAYVNNLLMVINRVKNDIKKVAFFQCIFPVLSILALPFASGLELVKLLVTLYIIAHVACIVIFARGMDLLTIGRFDKTLAKKILSVGFPLFIYNASFFCIIASTRSVISYFFPAEEFGQFSFAYNIANSLLLLLDAFSFLIFPKMISILGGSDKKVISEKLYTLRTNYIFISNFMLYATLLIYPILTSFFHEYQITNGTFICICLALIALTNCFGNNTFLMAQNKQKHLAYYALLALILNAGMALVVVLVGGTVHHVILVTFLVYLFYSVVIFAHSERLLNQRVNFINILRKFFGFSNFIPLTVLSIIIILKMYHLVFFGFVFFAALNASKFKEFICILRNIRDRPNIVNI